MGDEAVVHDVPYYAQWESAELVREIVGGAQVAAQLPRGGQCGGATPVE
ncbi:hypothetical protein ACFV4G_26930 [Kitasatospora sp. NPDC059747]